MDLTFKYFNSYLLIAIIAFLCNCSIVLSQNADEIVLTSGIYFWKLELEYDNTKNRNPVSRELNIFDVKEIDKRAFYKNVLKLNSQFTYKNQSNILIKLKRVVDSESPISNDLHTQVGSEFEKQNENRVNYDIKMPLSRSFIAAPSSKLEVYRLCFKMQGANIESDIISTNPESRTQTNVVTLEFEVKRNILGLSEIETQFANTNPRMNNTAEWKTIRDKINSLKSNANQVSRFEEFVKTLNTIKPRTSNVREWADVRYTCDAILNSWEDDKQLLFIKLLQRFAVTRPFKDNKAEWDRIRNLSYNILMDLVRTDF